MATADDIDLGGLSSIANKCPLGLFLDPLYHGRLKIEWTNPRQSYSRVIG